MRETVIRLLSMDKGKTKNYGVEGEIPASPLLPDIQRTVKLLLYFDKLISHILQTPFTLSLA